MAKIFCIGFSKTGTTTLEQALDTLGLRVCRGHYNNNHTNYLVSLYLNSAYDEIFRLIDYFDAFADAPWGGSDLYKVLHERYPDAKFILTLRDTESWYKSLIGMLTKFDTNLATAMDTFHAQGRYGGVYYFKSIFQIDSLLNAEQTIKEYYDAYNTGVDAFFSEQDPSRLFKFNLVDGEAWEKLCSFLGYEIPRTIFPHENIAAVKLT